MEIEIDSNFNYKKHIGKKVRMCGCVRPVDESGPKSCCSCSCHGGCRLYEKLLTILDKEGRMMVGKDDNDIYIPDYGDVVSITDDKFYVHKQKLSEKLAK